MARKLDGSASVLLTESEKNKILARAKRMGSKVYAQVCFNLDSFVASNKVIEGGILSPAKVFLCFPTGAAA